MKEEDIKKMFSDFKFLKNSENELIASAIDNLGSAQKVPVAAVDYADISREDILKNTVFYRITCLTFEKNFPRQESFENVITDLRNSNCRILYYLRGIHGHVEFYIGISSAFNSGPGKYHINDYENMLVRAVRGNFLGSEIEKADNTIIEGLADPDLTFRTVMGVPSRNTDNRDNISFQGVERLINVMNSVRSSYAQDFHLLVVWDALDFNAVCEFGRQVEDLYNVLSVYSHSSTQTGIQNSVQQGKSEQTGKSDSKSDSLTKGKSSSETSGTSETESSGTNTNKSSSTSESSGTSKSRSIGTSSSKTEGTSSSESEGSSHTSSEGSTKGSSDSKGKNTGWTHGLSGSSESDSKSGGTNDSHTTNSGTNKGTSDSLSKTSTSGKSSSETAGSSANTTEGSSTNTSKTSGSSEGTSKSLSKGTTVSNTNGTSESTTEGRSVSQNVSTGTSNSSSESASWSCTTEFKDKKLNDILKYIDEELMPRIKRGISKGMYRTAVYVGAGTALNCDLLCNTLMSLSQGDKNFNTSLYSKELPDNGMVAASLQIVRTPVKTSGPANSMLLESRPVIDGFADVGTWLTAQEISMLAGFPQKEVPGLALREQVPFGLNIAADIEQDEKVEIGHMMQEGCALSSQKVWLSRKELTKHVFIAGTTGSGKTTTCHRLLAASSGTGAALPFLVIEPAKTEYRALLESSTPGFSDIIVFTVGNGNGVPFRFNPLEFLENENLSGHIDQLKAAFMASFDMEAAIPNLMEQGLYRVYRLMGWDVETGENAFLQDRHEAWTSGGVFFPTISMYIETVVKLVEEKNFDARLRDEYIGSIRARLDSLIEGTKGVIFNTRLSVDFNDLINRQVIIELEDIKSSEDKSFLMALIISRLSEALKARHRTDPGFRHITLVEEAHRLLARCLPGDSQNRKMGVELFSDLLAEIRKYGESLIIVDQIPSKLASEVLKNTNTKIIHKLFSRDDKEAVGDTMALDENQRNYLSRLDPGEAVVFSQGWKKPVNVQVEQIDKATDNEDISLDTVCRNGRKYWLEHQERYSSFLRGIDGSALDWEPFTALARAIKRLYCECILNGEQVSDNLVKHCLVQLDRLCADKALKRKLIKTAVFDYSLRRFLLDSDDLCFDYQDYGRAFDEAFEEVYPDDEYKALAAARNLNGVINGILVRKHQNS